MFTTTKKIKSALLVMLLVVLFSVSNCFAGNYQNVTEIMDEIISWIPIDPHTKLPYLTPEKAEEIMQALMNKGKVQCGPHHYSKLTIVLDQSHGAWHWHIGTVEQGGSSIHHFNMGEFAGQKPYHKIPYRPGNIVWSGPINPSGSKIGTFIGSIWGRFAQGASRCGGVCFRFAGKLLGPVADVLMSPTEFGKDDEITWDYPYEPSYPGMETYNGVIIDSGIPSDAHLPFFKPNHDGSLGWGQSWKDIPY